MINLRGQPRRTRLAANVIYAVNRDAISSAVVLLTFNLRSTYGLLKIYFRCTCNDRSSTYIQLTTCFYVSQLGRAFK